LIYSNSIIFIWVYQINNLCFFTLSTKQKIWTNILVKKIWRKLALLKYNILVKSILEQKLSIVFNIHSFFFPFEFVFLFLSFNILFLGFSSGFLIADDRNSRCLLWFIISLLCNCSFSDASTYLISYCFLRKFYFLRFMVMD
jgi:hypothetical protein